MIVFHPGRNLRFMGPKEEDGVLVGRWFDSALREFINLKNRETESFLLQTLFMILIHLLVLFVNSILRKSKFTMMRKYKHKVKTQKSINHHKIYNKIRYIYLLYIDI